MADEIIVETTSTEVVEIGTPGPQGASGQGVPVGGTTGQVLRKASSTNYDTEWAAEGLGSGSVTSVALAGTGLSIGGSPITTSGTITANVSYGTIAGTATQGNDSRIANIRATSITTVIGVATDSDGAPVEGVGGDGGLLNLQGGTRVENQNGGNSGSINLQGGSGSDTGGAGANGGSINSNGGHGVSTATGGSLNMSGGNNNTGTIGFRGGNITTAGTATSAGGDINTSGGGSINTSGRGGGSIRLDGLDVALPSGSIDTRALSERGGDIETWGNDAAGGSINTSNGGGSINTRGTGSIELGVSGTRTTLTGTATAARAISLPNRSGTVVVSDTTAGTGSDVVNNIVSLTQAEYNAIGSPDAATLYLITDP